MAVSVGVSKSWRLGFTTFERTKSSAAHRYVSKYVTKKATKEWDKEDPEWHLASKHPGLGADAVEGLCESLLFYGYFDGKFDVPSFVELNGKKLPLDFYIRDRMRTYIKETYGIICDPSEGSREFPSHDHDVRNMLTKISIQTKHRTGRTHLLLSTKSHFVVFP